MKEDVKGCSCGHLQGLVAPVRPVCLGGLPPDQTIGHVADGKGLVVQARVVQGGTDVLVGAVVGAAVGDVVGFSTGFGCSATAVTTGAVVTTG